MEKTNAEKEVKREEKQEEKQEGTLMETLDISRFEKRRTAVFFNRIYFRLCNTALGTGRHCTGTNRVQV